MIEPPIYIQYYLVETSNKYIIDNFIHKGFKGFTKNKLTGNVLVYAVFPEYNTIVLGGIKKPNSYQGVEYSLSRFRKECDIQVHSFICLN